MEGVRQRCSGVPLLKGVRWHGPGGQGGFRREEGPAAVLDEADRN